MEQTATKPVMWTDEEASTRLKKWLIKLGWVGERNYIHNYLGADNYGKFFDLTPLMIRVNIRDSYSNEHSFIDDISAILQYESITLDSLLHDLNIIKPIGRLEYTSEWIDKILSGQKTMDILPTQHACGYYELWDTERQEVGGIVEVMDVSILRFRIEKNNLPSLCEFHAGVDSEFSDSNIKGSLKAIREERNALTKELLNACEDEYFFGALAGGYGKEMNLKSIDEWTNKQACKNILQMLGWTQEKVSKADFKNVLKRIDLLRVKRVGHERAVDLVKEKYSPRDWHMLMYNSGELERLLRIANNIPNNNAVTEYDKTKELELVSIIETFTKEHKTFKLESLMQHLKDINYHFYHIPNEDDAGTMEKVAMIVHAYFDCEVVHTKNGNYWKVERRLTIDDYAQKIYGEGISISDISIMLNYSPRPESPSAPVPQGKFAPEPSPIQPVPERFSFSDVFQYNAKIMAQKCGFKMFQDFITHHHDNFQSVKYAITYRVVDIKGVWNEV